MISITSIGTLITYLCIEYYEEENTQQQRSFIPLENVTVKGDQEDDCAICLQEMTCGEDISLSLIHI